jgi:hypothetical protein
MGRKSRRYCGRPSFKTIFINGILQHGMHDDSDMPLKIGRPIKRHMIPAGILVWIRNQRRRLPIDIRRSRYRSPARTQSPERNSWR